MFAIVTRFVTGWPGIMGVPLPSWFTAAHEDASNDTRLLVSLTHVYLPFCSRITKAPLRVGPDAGPVMAGIVTDNTRHPAAIRAANNVGKVNRTRPRFKAPGGAW
jgi:hypothetical protein